MSSGVIPPPSRVQRNVLILACSQALSVSTQTMTLITSPLVGHMLLGSDKSLSTMPIFIIFGSMMVGTIPASLLMKQIGRRAGFSLAAGLSIAGGLICAYSVFIQSFWILCLGSVLQGLFISFAQYYRFAAADNADPQFRPKAISLVLTGGVVAGIIGAQAAKWSFGWFAPINFMGVYVMISIFAFLNLVIMQMLSIPNLTVEQRR
ncbi:MAG: MFS transporter, partial [Desulfobulbia bacterium]